MGKSSSFLFLAMVWICGMGSSSSSPIGSSKISGFSPKGSYNSPASREGS